MDYKITAPNIPAENGSGTLSTSRICKGRHFYQKRQNGHTRRSIKYENDSMEDALIINKEDQR